MGMLGLKKATDKLAKVNGIRWYDHVLKQPEEDVFIKVMVHEVDKKQTESTEDEMEKTSQKHEKDWFKERRCKRSMQVERKC